MVSNIDPFVGRKVFPSMKFLVLDHISHRLIPRNFKGVFLVSAKNAFLPVKRDNSVNTYSRISTVPRGSERSE